MKRSGNYERFHAAQKLADALDHFQEGRFEEQTKRRLIPAYTSHFDNYQGGRAELHVHFRWSDNRSARKRDHTGHVMKAEYCVVLGKLALVQGGFLGTGQAMSRGRYEYTIDPCATADHDKFTVLILVFQAAENAYIGEGRPLLPGSVRLCPHDRFESIGVESLGGGFEPLPGFGVIDHELTINTLSPNVSIFDWKASAFPALLGDAGNDNVIQCASEVVYEISEDNGDHGVRLPGNPGAIPKLAMAVRPPDADKLVRIAAGVVPGGSLELHHVLLRTLYLEPPRVGPGHTVDLTPYTPA